MSEAPERWEEHPLSAPQMTSFLCPHLRDVGYSAVALSDSNFIFEVKIAPSPRSDIKQNEMEHRKCQIVRIFTFRNVVNQALRTSVQRDTLQSWRHSHLQHMQHQLYHDMILELLQCLMNVSQCNRCSKQNCAWRNATSQTLCMSTLPTVLDSDQRWSIVVNWAKS